MVTGDGCKGVMRGDVCEGGDVGRMWREDQPGSGRDRIHLEGELAAELVASAEAVKVIQIAEISQPVWIGLCESGEKVSEYDSPCEHADDLEE